jgi:hypothetical protein
MCQWELGLSYMSLGDFESASECYRILKEVREPSLIVSCFSLLKCFVQESNWSKACYAYAEAITLYETGRDREQVVSLMESVPGLMKRIAGNFFLSLMYPVCREFPLVICVVQENPCPSRSFAQERHGSTGISKIG